MLSRNVFKCPNCPEMSSVVLRCPIMSQKQHVLLYYQFNKEDNFVKNVKNNRTITERAQCRYVF